MGEEGRERETSLEWKPSHNALDKTTVNQLHTAPDNAAVNQLPPVSHQVTRALVRSYLQLW